jgi:hypothetical protein
MFTVKKPPLTPNIVWDAENGTVLCRFQKGIMETNDRALVEKLRAMGYEVDGETETEPKKRTRKTPDGQGG